MAAYVFDQSIGSITMEEFIVAYKGKISKNHPDILVFCDTSIIKSPKFEVIKSLIDSLHFYYVEYADTDDLRIRFNDEVDKYIKKNYIEKNLLNWFISDFVNSNKYACVKNWCLLILSLALCLPLILLTFSYKSHNTEFNTEGISYKTSVYDGKVIMNEKTIKTTNNNVRVED